MAIVVSVPRALAAAVLEARLRRQPALDRQCACAAEHVPPILRRCERSPNLCVSLLKISWKLTSGVRERAAVPAVDLGYGRVCSARRVGWHNRFRRSIVVEVGELDSTHPVHMEYLN